MSAPLPPDLDALLTDLAELEAAKRESLATVTAAINLWRERERRLIVREAELDAELRKITEDQK